MIDDVIGSVGRTQGRNPRGHCERNFGEIHLASDRSRHPRRESDG